MAQLLIAYDTTEGRTRKIARYMGEVASRSGHEVQVIDIRRPPAGFSLEGFDVVLVGASIHVGKHSPRLASLPLKQPFPTTVACPYVLHGGDKDSGQPQPVFTRRPLSPQGHDRPGAAERRGSSDGPQRLTGKEV